MPNQQDIVNGLRGKLIDDTSQGSFYGMLGGRIYEGQAPQNTVHPLAVMHMITAIPEPTFDHSDTWNLTFQIDLFGKRSKGSAALVVIADKLRALLDRADLSAFVNPGTVSGEFLNVNIMNTDQGAPVIEEDTLRQTSQWAIFAAA